MVSESHGAIDQQTQSVQVLAVTAGAGYASDLVDRLDGDEGFDVTAVPSVNDAVESLSSAEDVECVVSDADTPEIDGVTFLQMVRVQHPDLPFFLFTNEADGSVSARAMSARVTDYFVGERLEQDRGLLADMIERAVDYYRLQCEDPDRGTRVRDVLDALPDMVYIAREDAVVHANAEAVDVVGVDDADGPVGRPLSAIFTDADATGGLAPLDAIAAGERAVDRSETTLIDAEGDTVPVDLTAARIVWEDEPAVLVVASDMTEQKERQAEMERVSDRYRTVHENVHEGLFTVDVVGDDFRYVDFNARMLEIVGVTAEEARGATPSELWGDEVRSTVTERYRECRDGGETTDFELELDLPGGTKILQTRLSPVVMDGEVTQIVGVSRDVTEERDREVKLAEVKERFQNFIENASDIITVLDERGDIQYVSPTVERVLGGSVDDYFDQNVLSDLVHPEDREGAEAMFAEVVAADPSESISTTGEFRLEDVDGGWVWTETTVSNVETDLGYVTVTRDITERKEQEAELTETSERLETLIDNIPGVVYRTASIESPWPMEVVGGQVEELTGHTAEAIEADRVLWGDDVVVDEDLDAVEREIVEAADEGRAFEITYRIETADGEVKHVWEQGAPIEEDNETVALDGIIMDITGRKEREAEIARVKDRFQAFVENASDVISVIDEDGEIKYTSPSVEDVMGYTPEERMGENGFDDIHPDDRDSVMEVFAESMASEDGNVEHVEYRQRTADGDWIWVETSGSNVETEQGFVVVTRDISERKETRAELERSEERLSMALDTAEAGVWESSVASEGVFWSASMERLFGVEPGEFEGKYEDFAARIHPDDRDDVMDGIRDAMEREARFDYEFRIVRDSGGERWVQASAEVVTDEPGQSDRMIGVAVDITERKEREIHLGVTDRMLRHNLRNDVNVIRGYAESIEEVATEPALPFARKILETSDDLMDMADKERDVVEVLTDKGAVAVVDVASVVRRVAESQRTAHPEATIDIDVPADVDARVPERFEEAVEELVENALFHSDRERPAVDLALQDDEDDVVLTVADDGPGIPEQDVKVLSEGPETPLEHGSGIGLWLVHWIVRRSNGTLDVEDNEPRGTVATVTVPRPEADASDDASHPNDGPDRSER